MSTYPPSDTPPFACTHPRQIIAHELSTQLVSLRLANVYDLSSRIFLLKFAKPEHREQLVIDSGFRAHLTAFARTTAAAPSPFIARLRKFLRTRRVTAVNQIGTDRIIEITFSDGQYRLFLEFYAGGNIVLTDAECTILGLLRNVSEGAEHEQYRLGLKYDLELRQNYGGVPELTKERLREGLGKAVERQREEANKPGKKQKQRKGDSLRKALAVTTTEFPPVLIEHVLLKGGFARETLPEVVIEDEELLGKLMGCLEKAGELLKEITSAEVAKGYIVAKRKNGAAGPKEGEEQGGLLYEDFHPFKPAQLEGEGVEFIEYEGFNKAVDEFFSSIEGQRLESKLQEREDAARRKIDAARQEQEKRIEGLQQTADLNVQKAQVIEANVERVEEAVAAVNGLIAQGMDWVDIGRLIENEQARQNPVAQTIKTPLKLNENTVTLLLSGYDDVADEDMADETDSEASDSEAEDTPAGKGRAKPEDKRLAIDIDLAQSPWANARLYYDQRRTATVKQEKTAQASVKALKSTEQKVMADLKKGLKQEKDVLRPVRKQLWFEKFTYFVSSDGYLVLAGKDVQQTETLYRRYMKKGDAYVHADLPGAESVIIKNNPATPGAPIPPSTLSQAGNLAVCTSNAWDSKAIMSAWWVPSEHVSKIAPTGEFLAPGNFNIKGKKSFLPPAQLLLGFGVLFQISEESKARHFKNRLGNESSTPAPAGDESLSADKELVEEILKERADEDDDEDDEFPDAGRGADDDHAAAADGDDDDDDDDFPDAQDEDQDNEDHKPTVRSNPLQSQGAAADKNESNSDSDDEDESSDEQDEPQTTETKPEASSTKPKQPAKSDPEPKQKKMTRGKRGKAKRQAAKYAEQDDEDRELAMKLLGSRAAEERREAEAAEKVVEKESAEEARARRRAQHEKAQKEGLEAEKLRQLTLEEGSQELDEEEAAQMALLDAFVGTPLPGDDILEAIPVCAPWTALAKYKYKVKLQPGQQKKGKAIREILTVWNKAGGDKKNVDPSAQDKEMIWPREADLVRGLKEVEVVGIVPVKTMRVMMSGGAAAAADKGKGGAKGRGAKKGRGGKGSKKK
jgi:predicted ribosome quality control (RQC) complex YloA/Tae2 family protein